MGADSRGVHQIRRGALASHCHWMSRSLPHRSILSHRQGRVCGWIRRALFTNGAALVERQPGDTFDLQSAPGRTVIGVTELLLDPAPAQVDQFYSMGIWSRFVPGRRRLLMRVSPFLTEEIVDNAALADPSLLIQIAEWQGQRVLIASTDLIAAEVIGRGLRSIAQPAGDIGETPWQSDLVRIASERGLGADVRSRHRAPGPTVRSHARTGRRRVPFGDSGRR